MTLTPQSSDTRLVRWKKILEFWQEHLASPRYDSNDPAAADTLRVTLVKLLRSITNTGSSTPEPPVTYDYTLYMSEDVNLPTFRFRMTWWINEDPTEMWAVEWRATTGKWYSLIGPSINPTEEVISENRSVSFTPPEGWEFFQGDQEHIEGGDNQEFGPEIGLVPGSWDVGIWVVFNTWAGLVPLNCPSFPPFGAVITDVQPTSRNIAWEAVQDPAVKFLLAYYDINLQEAVIFVDVDPFERSYNVTGLTEDVQYCFQVSAIGNNNCVATTTVVCDA